MIRRARRSSGAPPRCRQTAGRARSSPAPWSPQMRGRWQPASKSRPADRNRGGPSPSEVAPFDQVPARPPEPLHRAVVIGVAPRYRRPGGATKGATDAFGCVFQGTLQPRIKGFGVQAARLAFGQDAKERVDTRFDRAFAQQVGTEAVIAPMCASSRFIRASSRRCLEAASRLASLVRRSSSCRRRSFSSPAAFSVNVTATRFPTPAFPVASTRTIRRTSSVVLPVPAAASTTNVESRSLAIASRAP